MKTLVTVALVVGLAGAAVRLAALAAGPSGDRPPVAKIRIVVEDANGVPERTVELSLPGGFHVSHQPEGIGPASRPGIDTSADAAR